MAAVSPPLYLQNAALPASSDRAMLAALLRGPFGSPRAGVLPYGNTGESPLAYTASGPADNKVTIPALVAVIPDGGLGVYIGINDAPTAVVMTPAHATLDRKDLIVARVRDSETGGSLNTFAIEPVTGTASATPVAPATPAKSLLLAEVYVTHGGTTAITSGNITLKASLTGLRGSVIPSLAAHMPGAAQDPELRLTTDTNNARAYVSVPGTTPYPISHPDHEIDAVGNLITPAHTWLVTAPAAAMLGAIGYRALNGRIELRGTLVHRDIPFTSPTNMPVDTNYLVGALPAGARPAGTVYGLARFLDASYVGLCEIRSDGSIYVRTPAGAATTTVALDGITLPM